MVRKTGAGDLTAEISFERNRNNAAGAQLGLVLMIVMLARLVLVVLIAPFDAVLSLLGAKPWIVEARKLDRARRTHRWRATGWRSSTELVSEIDASLRSGRPLPVGAVAVGA
jgi:hypothetical protein